MKLTSVILAETTRTATERAILNSLISTFSLLSGITVWGRMDRPRWHHPLGLPPNESLIFCGWIYQEHLQTLSTPSWTPSPLGSGDGGSWRWGWKWKLTTTKKVLTVEVRTMTKNKKRSLRKKMGWHHQLPQLVTSTLVTPCLYSPAFSY